MSVSECVCVFAYGWVPGVDERTMEKKNTSRFDYGRIKRENTSDVKVARECRPRETDAHGDEIEKLGE